MCVLLNIVLRLFIFSINKTLSILPSHRCKLINIVQILAKKNLYMHKKIPTPLLYFINYKNERTSY